MDLLLNTLTEWLKELLAGAIASNLTGMVDSVNTKVGDIAVQVGQTPQGWNSGIFSMIQNLSNNVILPIAGIILALVMTMEFIRIIMMNHEWSQMGQNYLRSLFALAFQGFLIIVCVAIYAVLVQNMVVESDISMAIWTVMGYTVLLCFTLFKTSSLAKSVFNAH